MDLNLYELQQSAAGILRTLPWHWVAVGAHLALSPVAALHAMLNKRDPRAALGWVSVCLFFPLAGPVAYYLFGINRIQTRARRLARRPSPGKPAACEPDGKAGVSGRAAPPADPTLAAFVSVSNRVVARPLTAGNQVAMLRNGEQAYPDMLDAIGRAADRVLLITYLFENDATGDAFVAALGAAHARGVDVRVIVDGVGHLYSWPSISRKLRRAGVRVVRFLPPGLWPPSFSVNLRNHRKILVVDGVLGFTGGMNISARHLVESGSSGRTADLHFRVQGPVVAQLEEIFAEDWRFAAREVLGPTPVVHPVAGTADCRCIGDGPNEDLDRIALVVMAAISAARRQVTVVTPYFLPPREMIASLQSAALRGVDVAVVLPSRSNLRYVDWATRNLLWQLLGNGVRVYYQPPPFAHTKLLVVDDVYAQVGSANMDPRSLRLNFELNLEILGADAVRPLADYAHGIRAGAAAVELAELDARPLPIRIRDALCWLFLPYL